MNNCLGPGTQLLNPQDKAKEFDVTVVPTFIMVLVIWKLRNKSVLLGLSLYAIVTSISIALTLNYAFNLPVGITILTVLTGQTISCVIGGYIIHKALRRRFK